MPFYVFGVIALTAKDHSPFRVNDSEEPKTTELGHGVTWRAHGGRVYGYAKLIDGRDVVMVPRDATLSPAKLILFGRVSRDRFEFAGHGVCQAVIVRIQMHIRRDCDRLDKIPDEVAYARAEGEDRIRRYLERGG